MVAASGVLNRSHLTAHLFVPTSITLREAAFVYNWIHPVTPTAYPPPTAPSPLPKSALVCARKRGRRRKACRLVQIHSMVAVEMGLLSDRGKEAVQVRQRVSRQN